MSLAKKLIQAEIKRLTRLKKDRDTSVSDLAKKDTLLTKEQQSAFTRVWSGESKDADKAIKQLQADLKKL